MSDEAPPASDPELRVRSKVWVERDGTVIISDYRARLLAAIEAHGSVAGAGFFAADVEGIPRPAKEQPHRLLIEGVQAGHQTASVHVPIHGVELTQQTAAIVQLVSPWEEPPAQPARRVRLRYA